jgi:PKD repeat protein/prenyltransferase beta subunit
MNKKILTSALTFVFAMTLLVQNAPLYAESLNQGNGVSAAAQNFSSPPAVNWANVDFDRDVVLEKDNEKYYSEVSKLEAQNKYDEIYDLKKTVHKMYEDEVLQYYNVPFGIREEVVKYRHALEGIKDSNDELNQRENLKQQLKTVLAINWASAENNKNAEQTIDVSNAKILNPGNVNFLNTSNQPRIRVLEKTTRSKTDQRFFDATHEGLIQKSKKPSSKRSSFNILNKTADALYSMVFGTAYADDSVSPLIEYYEGIEQNTMDYALYYLSEIQNSDGSFGKFNKYELTAHVVFMLSEFNVTSSGQFTAAVKFLTDTVPQNNREKALKVRILISSGKPYQSLLDDLVSSKNDDGGYGLDYNYASDAETTMEAALAFYAADYGIQTHLPQALAFVMNKVKSNGAMYYTPQGSPSFYLINKTAQSFKPFQNMTVNDGQNQVTVQSKIDSLINYLTTNYSSLTDVIDKAMTTYTFQLYSKESAKQEELKKSVNDSQSFDGGFGNSLYATIFAMRALAVPDVALTNLKSITGLTNKVPVKFELTIKNKGYASMGESTLYTFIDNVNFNYSINLNSNDVNLASQQSAVMTISFDDTVKFVGETEIKFYAEGASDNNFLDNWISNIFTFAGASDNSPALQMYYIAQQYDTQGVPGLNIRWKVKPDPNRLNYIAMWREQGTSQWQYYAMDNTWSGAFLTGGFVEGKIYEVTAGVLHKDGTTVTSFSDTTNVQVSGDESKYTSAFNGYITVDNKPTEDLYAFGYTMNAYTMNSDASGAIKDDTVPNGSNAVKADPSAYESIHTVFDMPTGQTVNNIRIFTRFKPDTTPPVVADLYIQSANNATVKNQQEVSLVTYGSDNVAIKTADFWYFNPSQAAWVYIDKGDFDGGNPPMFKWYIPDNLIGDGYKIKTVFTDFQNNKSAPKEWGPFTIIDGTVPTGSITVNGLTNNQWSLGETKNISWVINTKNPLKKIASVALKYGNGYETLKSDYDITKTSLDHTLPFNASYVTDNAFIKMSVCDVNYNCGEILSPVFEIADKTPPPHAPWGMPKVFDGITSTYGQERFITNVFDNPDGSIEIIYKEYFGYYYEPAGQYRRIVYRKFKDGVWQNPVVLKEHLYILDKTSEISFYEIKAVKGNDGDIHLVYQQAFGGGAEGLDKNEVYYLHVENGVKVFDKQLSNNTTDSHGPAVAVTNSGVVSISWIDGYSFTNKTGVSTLRYMEGDGMQSWGSEETLTDDNTVRPAIIAEGDSKIIIYIYKEEFYFRKKSGGVWSTPIAINKAGIPKNEYADNSSEIEVFAKGGNVYDIFYWQGTATTGYKYNVKFIRTLVDTTANTAAVQNAQTITPVSGKDEITSYRVAKNSAGNYQMFYIKREFAASGTYMQRPYHLLFTGTNTYFKTHTAPLTMYAETAIVAGTENNNKLMIFFAGYIDGGLQTLYNSADYGPIINHKLDPSFPLDNAADIIKQGDFKWTATGGQFDSFDVLFGTDFYYLNTIATGLTGTSYAMPALSPFTSYYWQIVGHYGNYLVYSNPWAFTTQGIANPKIVIEKDGVAIESGQSYDFGNVKVGSDSDSMFIIKNLGTTDLVLTGDPLVNITGSNADQFAVASPPSGTVAAGNATGLFIKFKPDSSGDKNAIISISSNDEAKNPYTINIKGKGILPLEVTATATPDSGYSPLKVQFDASATGGYSEDYTYKWDVNTDGVIDYIIKNPSDTYTVVGTHTASLTISDGVDSVTKKLTITVNEQPPLPVPLSVSITADPMSGIAPLNVGFSSTVSGGKSSNYVYDWDLNGDGFSDSTVNNPTYLYETAGSYIASLKVSDGFETVTKNLTIVVDEPLPPPEPLALTATAIPLSGTVPLKITLDASASGGSSSNYTYFWNVPEDGNSQNIISIYGQNQTYTYTVPGTYTVTANVSDGTDTVSKQLKITAAAVAKPFSIIVKAHPSYGSAPLKVNFGATLKNAKSRKIIYKWYVDGDGEIDYTTKNPVHTYTSPGTYTVIVEVTSGNEVATGKITIEVTTGVLSATISAQPLSGTAPLFVQFNANVSGGNSAKYTYKWDIDGNGTVDYTTKNPSHTYTAAGKYPAVFKVLDGQKTVTKHIIIKVQ